jgi:transposase
MSQDTVRAKNRFKSQFRRRGIPCSGTSVYDPRYREQWLEQLPTAMRPPVKLLGRELDHVTELKAQAEAALVEASHRYRISRVLETAPGIGPIRAAVLIATVITPHRFRSKRQFWSYCGFGVVTRSSADWVQTQSGWIKAQAVRTRGLNRNHNPTLKGIFKGAAITVIHQTQADHPLKQAYARLLDGGTRPPLARLTIARKIAATVLAMWKTEEVYRAGG